MLIRFFTDLRAGGVPVTLPEFLSLLEALEARVAALSPEEFYYLARMALVKDERHFDRFDRVFAEHFAGAEKLFEKLVAELPAEWLQQLTERLLTEEEKRRVEALGGWDKLLETLRQRLREQQGRHEGGNKWIGTGGHFAVRQPGLQPRRRAHRAGRRRATGARSRSGTRATIATSTTASSSARAISRWRCGACAASRAKAPPEELDLDGTIDATARNAGLAGPQAGAGAAQRRETAAAARRRRLDGSARQDLRGAVLGGARRVQAPRVLLLPQLSVRALVEGQPPPVQRDHRARWSLLRTFNPDYRVVFVGDATMSPYEIEQPGGSVEHWNEESGRVVDDAHHARISRASCG